MKLWQEVDTLPASEQIPLFDPAMAGERALYFLETIEPVKLFWQIFQVSLIACFGCLQRGAAAQLGRIQHESTVFLKSLKSGIHDLEHQPEIATQLLEQFKALERSFAVGESLLRHLPGCRVTVELLLNNILSQTPHSEGASHGIRVPDAEKERILSLLLPGSKSDSASEGDKSKKALCGTVLQHEWVVTCRKSGFEGDHGNLCHRLYFKDAVNEVRLGTVLVSEL